MEWIRGIEVTPERTVVTFVNGAVEQVKKERPTDVERVPPERAREVAKRPKRARPEEAAIAFLLLGDMAFHQGDFPAAERSYRRALDIARRLGDEFLVAVSSNVLGAALGMQGRHEEALRLFDEALKLRPDYAEAWFNKGFAFGKLGRDKEALKCYEEAVRLRPNFAEAWGAKGALLWKHGKIREAVEAFEKAKEGLSLEVKALASISISLLRGEMEEEEFDRRFRELRGEVSREEYMEAFERKRESFREKEAELRAEYGGKYVAFYGGEVLDSDEDLGRLVERVRREFGERVPIYIGPVGEVRPLRLRSPRLKG